MTNVEEATRIATQQVEEAVRWIQEHYKSSGVAYSYSGMGEDPYAARAKREEAIDSAAEIAQSSVLIPSILRHLCPGLRSASGDVFEVSKILVGVLVPLSVAGTISLSWNPLVIAAAAFVIVRAGIASVCKGYEGPSAK